MTNPFPSDPAQRLRLYWLAWLGTVVLALLLRFTFLLGAGRDAVGTLAETYLLLSWVAVAAINFAEGRTMTAYLRLHHLRHWEWLTSGPLGGPGWHNGFRGVPWLYSADDLGDPVVGRHKRHTRALLRWVYTVFLSYPIIVPVLAWS